MTCDVCQTKEELIECGQCHSISRCCFCQRCDVCLHAMQERRDLKRRIQTCLDTKPGMDEMDLCVALSAGLKEVSEACDELVREKNIEPIKAKPKKKPVQPECRPVFVCTKGGTIVYVALDWDDAKRHKAAFGCTIWSAMVDRFLQLGIVSEPEPTCRSQNTKSTKKKSL